MARKKFTANNPFAVTMKKSKGRACDRKAMLRGVAKGLTPDQAVSRFCGAAGSAKSRKSGR